MDPRHGGLSVVILLVAGLARSADTQRPVRFDYAAESGCPDEKLWQETLLSRAPAARLASGDEPAWTLRARIVREGSRFAGRLQVITPEAASDTRRFRASSCEQVALALAIAGALSVDPEHGAAAPTEPVETPRPAEAPTPPPVPPPPVPRVLAHVEARPGESETHIHGWAIMPGAAAVLIHSAIDDAMWGGELLAHVAPGPDSPIALRASAGYVQSLTVRPSLGAAHFYLPQAALEVCVTGIDHPMASLGACAGARGGALVGSGADLDRPSSSVRGWFVWIAGLRSELVLGRGLRAEVMGSLALRQTRYTYIFDRPPLTITDPPWVGWELSLGVLLPH